MKKTINIKYFLIGLGLTYFASSCVDLEEKVYSQITSDNFFKTDEEFISALGGRILP